MIGTARSETIRHRDPPWHLEVAREMLGAVDVTRIHRLENPVQHYAWGSYTAIPELFGHPAPAAQPWAELWMGAHPSAPSRVATRDAVEPLDSFIARDPAAVLGEAVAARFSGTLPFLFKVIASAEPLSIQAHPNLAQARAGFDRENRRGLALDDPARCYRDQNHKPELICALGAFRALNRFRDPSEVADRFSALGVPALERAVAALCASRHRRGLAAFFETLWTLDSTSRQLAIAGAIDWARPRADRDTAAHWVMELSARYPGDIGALAPLLLNVVELSPGESMYLPAGELHTYLEGVGLEIMASSDNVLRGGLTVKYVDIPELLRTLTFDSGPVERLRPQAIGPGEAHYPTASEEFELSVTEVRPGAGRVARSVRAIEILLCTRGRGRLVAAETFDLRSGDCVVVPAAASSYALEGDLTIHRAAPGRLTC